MDVILAPLPPIPMHSSWQVVWPPHRWPGALADAIAADPRFADRIIARMIADTWGPDAPMSQAPGPVPAPLMILHALAGFPDTLARHVGLRCLAPVLAPSLMDPARRRSILPLTRSDMQAVMAHCGQGAPVDRAVPDPLDITEDVIVAEGQVCLSAWIWTLPPPWAARLALTLPRSLHDLRDPVPAPVRDKYRADLVTAVLATLSPTREAA